MHSLHDKLPRNMPKQNKAISRDTFLPDKPIGQTRRNFRIVKVTGNVSDVTFAVGINRENVELPDEIIAPISLIEIRNGRVRTRRAQRFHRQYSIVI